MLKEQILRYLSEITSHWDFDAPDDAFTADHIARKLDVRRNTVSHYLNEGYAAGTVIKINTRPVYFLDLEVFSRQFGRPSKLLFSGVQELQTHLEHHAVQPAGAADCFQELVGAGGSLKSTIRQLKAALLYPGLGLPVLITGPSGVGKSMLAQLAHRFCVEHHILEADAPFLTLNCAQYASNPELLSSNLFGHVKGAFTGATSTVRGLLESADQGMLFLDEVHRLDHVGQEKLFTFMDQGGFRRMGEGEGWHRARVRLIFATTEDPESCMLTTFLRRIPIRVQVPALSERRERERMTLIYSFFLSEAKQLAKPLAISRPLLSILSSHLFPGNLGDLWNTIKCLCAAGFARSSACDRVVITPLDLPEHFLEDVRLDTNPAEYLELSSDTALASLLLRDYPQNQMVSQLHQSLLELYQAHQTDPSRFLFAVNDLFLGAKAPLQHVSIQPQEQKYLSLLERALRQFLLQSKNSYQTLCYSGDTVHLLACYLYAREQSELPVLTAPISAFWDWCQQQFGTSSEYAPRLLRWMESKFDLTLNECDCIFAALLLHLADLRSQSKRPQALILAHGNSTASSIANVVNQIYHDSLFDAFDVPFNCAPESILHRVAGYLSHAHLENGLILLVDTGSLLWLYRGLGELLTCSTLLINNVTTQTALQVGSLIRDNTPLEQILEEVRQETLTEYKLIQPLERRQNALLVHAIVGEGTAQKVKTLLEQSLPPNVQLSVVLSNGLQGDFQSELPELKAYNILAIIGASPPAAFDAVYISLEALMSGRGEESLRDALSGVMEPAQINYFCTHLIQNFSLDRLMDSLTILDHQKILAHVDQCLTDYQSLAQVTLSNQKKYSIYVHVSCLVERLIRQVPIGSYPNLAAFTAEHEKTIAYIRRAFHRLEEIYSVSIPLTEIGYLCDILLSPDAQETYSNAFDTE